jgi:hypothetical protein
VKRGQQNHIELLSKQFQLHGLHPCLIGIGLGKRWSSNAESRRHCAKEKNQRCLVHIVPPL